MPCYITVRIFQEEFEDINAMRKAAQAMGLRMEERGSEIWIAGEIKVTRQGKKYVMQTSNGNVLRSLMDEYAAAKVEREAKRRNLQVKKVKARDGEITLTITER